MTTQMRQLKKIEALMATDDGRPQVIVQIQFVNPADHSVTPGPRFIVGSGREVTEEEQ